MKQIFITCPRCIQPFLYNKRGTAKFCSKFCAQHYCGNKSRDMSHRKVPDWHKKAKHYDFCICGDRKSKKSQLCLKCYSIAHLEQHQNKTIAYYCEQNHNNPNSYVHIRMSARNVLKRANMPKKCSKCSYDKHVEVCHIKSISSFPKSTIIKIVNDLSNLMYLCPNCHWEYDNAH